jgi:hypothetical protein
VHPGLALKEREIPSGLVVPSSFTLLAWEKRLCLDTYLTWAIRHPLWQFLPNTRIEDTKQDITKKGPGHATGAPHHARSIRALWNDPYCAGFGIGESNTSISPSPG